MRQPSKTGTGRLAGRLGCASAGNPGWAQRPAPLTPGLLRVCADMDNLPFSNQKGEGYENKIAELIANEWHSKLEYTWWPIRRGYYRMLNGTYCDLVIESPVGVDQAGATKPYYRSGYMFLSRKGSGLEHINSLADPGSRSSRSGSISLFPPTGSTRLRDGAEPVRRGGQPGGLQRCYDRHHRPEDIINAVAKKDVDLAIVWGPQAGYFAKKSAVPLVLTPLATEVDSATGYPHELQHRDGSAPQGPRALRDSLQTLLDRKQSEILGILKQYGVPAFAGEGGEGGMRRRSQDRGGPRRRTRLALRRSSGPLPL